MTRAVQINDEERMQVLQRLETLALKLGLDSESAWNFIVEARRSEGRRLIFEGAVLALLAITLFAWTHHVAYMKIPHKWETEIRTDKVPSMTPCTLPMLNPVTHKMTSGLTSCQMIEERPVSFAIDKGVSVGGYAYIAGAVLALLAGLVLTLYIVKMCFDGWEIIRTAEADSLDETIAQLGKEK